MDNTETPSHVSLGHRVPKDENHPYGWEMVDDINPEEACVLFLGGSGAKSDENANGYAKSIDNDIIQTDAQLKDKGINVYSIAYNFNSFNDNSARSRLLKKYGRRHQRTPAELKKYRIKNKDIDTVENNSPNYVQEIFDKVIKNRISAQNGTAKLNVEEACRRIRKLTIVAHCHGAYTALKLEELMQEKMASLGYTKHEREKIQQQMFIAAHAPACPLGISKSTMISFCSSSDNKIDFHGNYAHYYIKQRQREDSAHYYAQEDGNKERIDTNRPFNIEPSFLDKKQGNIFLVKDIFQYGDEGPLAEHMGNEHEFYGYRPTSGMTKDGQLLTLISREIIASAIKNSLCQKDSFTALPEVDELLCGKDENKKKAFARMLNSGKKLWNDMVSELRTIAPSLKRER